LRKIERGYAINLNGTKGEARRVPREGPTGWKVGAKAGPLRAEGEEKKMETTTVDE